MQIVINISKKLYDRYKEKDHIKRCDIDEFEKALDKCIILPKGHGKIVDIDKLIDRRCNECGHLRGVSCTIPCREVRRMLGADTIIEADKAESEDAA